MVFIHDVDKLPSGDAALVTRLSPEVEAIAERGPLEPAEMLRALSALGKGYDDTRTAHELSAARACTISTDAAVAAVRGMVRT